MFAQFLDHDQRDHDALVGLQEDEQDRGDRDDGERPTRFDGPFGTSCELSQQGAGGIRLGLVRFVSSPDEEDHDCGRCVEDGHDTEDPGEVGEQEQEAGQERAADPHRGLTGLRERHGRAQVRLLDHVGQHGPARRVEESGAQSGEHRQDDDLPALSLIEQQEDEQHAGGGDVGRQRADQHSPMGEAVDDDPSNRSQQERGRHVGGQDHPEQEGGAGQFDNQDRAGDGFQPERG